MKPHLKPSVRETIYNDFLTGKYYLHELAEKHDVAIDTVTRIIDKEIKKKRAYK